MPQICWCTNAHVCKVRFRREVHFLSLIFDGIPSFRFLYGINRYKFAPFFDIDVTFQHKTCLKVTILYTIETNAHIFQRKCKFWAQKYIFPYLLIQNFILHFGKKVFMQMITSNFIIYHTLFEFITLSYRILLPYIFW